MPPRSNASSSTQQRRRRRQEQQKNNNTITSRKERELLDLFQTSERINRDNKSDMRMLEIVGKLVSFGFMCFSFLLPFLDPHSDVMPYHAFVSIIACFTCWYVGNPKRKVHLVILILQILLFVFPLPTLIVFLPDPAPVHICIAVCYDFLQIWGYILRDQLRASLDAIKKTNEILAHQKIYINSKHVDDKTHVVNNIVQKIHEKGF